MNSSRLQFILKKALAASGGITVLTGAGISAESGIPTFRGPEGYWTIGSRMYKPQEVATVAMFRRNPRAVWQWYLYRLGVCRSARPNSGHLALVAMEQHLKQRFTLITQNVDNLHLHAGQSAEKTYQIHGNLFYTRCSDECSRKILPLPEGIKALSRNEPIQEAQWRKLFCPSCGARLRPHVLWFDETYNEHNYRMESALAAARRSVMLIVVGTAGATTLPNRIVSEVCHNRGFIVDINNAENRFGLLAAQYDRGVALVESAGTALPKMALLLADILKHGTS